jgi:NTP pyrophosphatase (non-canonical NTP hydrolase)
MNNVNGLTAAEAERLTMLAEECAEVIQAVSKILRHGYESRNPDLENSPTNREHLDKEVLDFYSVQMMMLNAGDLRFFDGEEVGEARRRKLRYTHFQGGDV